jgi:hypothetical protein
MQTVDDALTAEELASLLVASWAGGDPRAASDPTELAVTSISTLERMGALRALVAIRSVTESDLRHLVDMTVQRLVLNRGAVVPNWADLLSRVELVEALHVTETLRDQDLWALRFRYSDDDPASNHVLTVSIDRNRSGIVRDITLGHPETADMLFAAWRSAPDGDEHIKAALADPGEAAIALATALARTDVTGGTEVTQKAIGLLPLLRSRLRALPPVAVPQRELVWQQLDDADEVTLAAQFATEIAELPPAEPLPEGVDRQKLARSFLESTGLADEMLRWSPIRVEMVLLDWLPRRVILTPAEIAATPDVLRAFVRWALARQGIPADAIETTVAAVGRWEGDFAAAMADESRFGSGKLRLLQMRREGVDIEDPDAVGRWIDEHQEETDWPEPGAS